MEAQKTGIEIILTTNYTFPLHFFPHIKPHCNMHTKNKLNNYLAHHKLRSDKTGNTFQSISIRFDLFCLTSVSTEIKSNQIRFLLLRFTGDAHARTIHRLLLRKMRDHVRTTLWLGQHSLGSSEKRPPRQERVNNDKLILTCAVWRVRNILLTKAPETFNDLHEKVHFIIVKLKFYVPPMSKSRVECSYLHVWWIKWRRPRERKENTIYHSMEEFIEGGTDTCAPSLIYIIYGQRMAAKGRQRGEKKMADWRLLTFSPFLPVFFSRTENISMRHVFVYVFLPDKIPNTVSLSVDNRLEHNLFCGIHVKQFKKIKFRLILIILISVSEESRDIFWFGCN